MKVGFIGLGMMGAGMASNLQKSQHQLVVHDLSRAAAKAHLDAGATWVDSPRAVAEACDVVFLSLPTPKDVEAVTLGPDGVLAGLRRGNACFDLSTNSVEVVRRLGAACAERGVEFMDAPVSGGPSGAASGKLAIWVGGDQSTYNKYQSVLEAMGDQAAYIGPIGAGTIAKLVHNATGAALNCVLAEVFSMGIKAGVEPLELWKAVRQGANGRVRVFDRLPQHFLTGVYDPPPFALRLLAKDVGLATELGRQMGVPMRMVNLAQQELQEAMNRGWGNRGSNVAMVLQLERAGVEPLAVKPENIKAVFDAEKK